MAVHPKIKTDCYRAPQETRRPFTSHMAPLLSFFSHLLATHHSCNNIYIEKELHAISRFCKLTIYNTFSNLLILFTDGRRRILCFICVLSGGEIIKKRTALWEACVSFIVKTKVTAFLFMMTYNCTHLKTSLCYIRGTSFSEVLI